MRILLDECLDRRFAKELSGHDVTTVPRMGWAGIKNGELMSRAEKNFDIFITVDRNLSYQQNLPTFDIAVIVIGPFRIDIRILPCSHQKFLKSCRC